VLQALPKHEYSGQSLCHPKLVIKGALVLTNTVDGRNPAPPDMHEALQIMGYLLYQLVDWDFFQ